MKIGAILIVAGLVFGLCFLIDKVFSKLFRGKQQHQSGLSVRFHKRYGSIGLIVAVLGLAAILSGITEGMVMIVAGAVLIFLGIGLIVYYMTFGIYYDDEAFIYTSFGKKSITYQYKDIQSQQLYNNAGNILIELHLVDGKAIQLQASMEGVYPFLDKAFAKWLEQTGRKQEDCAFYDPQNSCWFPLQEG